MTVTIIPGVELDVDGEDSAIYFRDDKGEIVTWNFDEVREDPSAWTASLLALATAIQEGLPAVRNKT